MVDTMEERVLGNERDLRIFADVYAECVGSELYGELCITFYVGYYVAI